VANPLSAVDLEALERRAWAADGLDYETSLALIERLRKAEKQLGDDADYVNGVHRIEAGLLKRIHDLTTGLEVEITRHNLTMAQLEQARAGNGHIAGAPE
jgi:hypothetical protein